MKKIVLLFSFVGLLVACNHNAPNEGKFEADPDSGFVHFGTTITNAPGNNNVQIPLVMATATNSEGLAVTYKVEAVANDGSDTDVPSEILGTFTDEDAVPAGNLSGFLTIDLTEPPIGTCYEIKVTLLSTNNEVVKVGLTESDETEVVQFPKESIVTVGAIADSYYGTTYFQGSPVLTFDPILTAVEGETNVYLIDTAWGVQLLPTLNPALDALPYDGTLTIHSDGSVTIAGNAPYATGGTGQYDACTGEISYTLTQAYLSDSTITFDVVLTPVMQ